jgi:hypothetical protein
VRRFCAPGLTLSLASLRIVANAKRADQRLGLGVNPLALSPDGVTNTALPAPICRRGQLLHSCQHAKTRQPDQNDAGGPPLRCLGIGGLG